MNAHIHALRMGLVGLGLLATTGDARSVSQTVRSVSQSVTSEGMVLSVRRMLERLPYCGVFDN
jgi:hypothetical protein